VTAQEDEDSSHSVTQFFFQPHGTTGGDEISARSTTLYIRNGADKEDIFFIFAQRHFLYTGRCVPCINQD
jgi:hypothetical protein